MVQPMEADFKAAADQTFAKCFRNLIVRSDKIEGRTKTVFPVDLGQRQASIKAFGRFDVVSDHKRELLSLRPSAPTRRGTSGLGIDRPDVSIKWKLSI